MNHNFLEPLSEFSPGGTMTFVGAAAATMTLVWGMTGSTTALVGGAGGEFVGVFVGGKLTGTGGSGLISTVGVFVGSGGIVGGGGLVSGGKLVVTLATRFETAGIFFGAGGGSGGVVAVLTSGDGAEGVVDEIACEYARLTGNNPKIVAAGRSPGAAAFGSRTIVLP